jgi:hypothetical protein
VGVAVVMWRTVQLQSLPEFDRAVELFRLLAG